MPDINFTPLPNPQPWVIPPPEGLPYVSVTAIKRVRDALPIPTACPYCQGKVVLVNNETIYGRSVGDWPFLYACAGSCEAHVGVHADTAIPLGTLANKELRAARQCAKQSFHAMMLARRMVRTNAYKWLADKLGLPLQQTHYGWMDLPTVQRAHLITEAELNRKTV